LQCEDGSAVYVRLTTRQIDQPKRSLDARLCAEITRGAYWAAAPSGETKKIIAYAGAVAPEAHAAFEALSEKGDDAALLAVTSPDCLHAEWLESAGKQTSHIETLLREAAPDARLVTVLDGSPMALGWIGTAGRFQTRTLGVTAFGVSGDIPDLYRKSGIDCAAILDAFASMEA
jgi:pyruvate dehydrogenase E1 component